MSILVQKEFHLTGHQASIYALSKGQNDYLIYTGSSDKMVARWNLKNKANDTFVIKMPLPVYALLCSEIQNHLLIGTASGNLHVVDLELKTELKNIQLHTQAIYHISINSSSQLLFTSAANGDICCLHAKTYQLISKINLGDKKVRSLFYIEKDNILLAACGDGLIRILEVPSLRIISEFFAHNLSANMVIKHPVKDIILTGGRDAHLNIFEWPSLKMVQKIPAHNFAIYDIVFNKTNNLFATASRDKTIKIWDSNSFDFLYRIDKEKNDGHINSVNKLVWSSYNDILVSAGDDRALMGWTVIKSD